MQVIDVLIIGAGPAGLATAIQLRRHGIEPLVLERDQVGGLLRNANLVENYPGFPDGIPGPALVRLFEQQAQNAGVRVVFEEVQSLDYNGNGLLAKTAKSLYNCSVVVVASGTRPRQLAGLQIPAELEQRVFYEVYSLRQVSGRRIAIIGAGDAAFDYALNLSTKGNQVLILNRGQERKCLPLLWERALAEPGIRYYESTQIVGLAVDSQGRIRLDCSSLAGEVDYRVDFVLVAIGREPRLDFISPRLEAASEGLLASGRLYRIGDVTKGIYRQTAIAVGEGVLTAMKIHWRRKEATSWKNTG